MTVIEVDQKNSDDEYDTVEYRVRFNTLQIDKRVFYRGRWRWHLLGRIQRCYDNSFGHNHSLNYYSNKKYLKLFFLWKNF